VLTASQMVATRFPYLLRAAALDETLSPHELGRVFLHLSQRRGFKSNRKAANAPTLGAYLSGLNPHEQRIRTLRISREMFETEFEKIVEVQASHHAIL